MALEKELPSGPSGLATTLSAAKVSAATFAPKPSGSNEAFLRVAAVGDVALRVAAVGDIVLRVAAVGTGAFSAAEGDVVLRVEAVAAAAFVLGDLGGESSPKRPPFLFLGVPELSSPKRPPAPRPPLPNRLSSGVCKVFGCSSASSSLKVPPPCLLEDLNGGGAERKEPPASGIVGEGSETDTSEFPR